MVNLKDKNCTECGSVFSPTGRAAKYCGSCAERKRKEATTRAIRKRAKMPGVGKGGFPHRGKDHPLYTHGRFTYETIRNEIRQDRKCCERCSKDVSEAGHYEWVIHHRDHNQYNSALENLELLCKRCHQIEHQCWKAFEGATTIPKGSRAKRPEAPDSPEEG